MMMSRLTEQGQQLEIQRRKEMLANYLQTVLLPNDQKLQSLILELRKQSGDGVAVPVKLPGLEGVREP